MTFENLHACWGWKELHRASKFKPGKFELPSQEGRKVMWMNPPALYFLLGKCALCYLVDQAVPVMSNPYQCDHQVLNSWCNDYGNSVPKSCDWQLPCLPHPEAKASWWWWAICCCPSWAVVCWWAELLFCCWAERYTWGEGERGWDISDISFPLQPSRNTPGTLPLTEMSLGFLSTIEYSWTARQVNIKLFVTSTRFVQLLLALGYGY